MTLKYSIDEFIYFRDSVLHSLCHCLICQPFTPQLHYYVLPAMVAQQPAAVFKHLLRALLPRDRGPDSQGVQGSDSVLRQLAVHRTVWLLCAVLLYAEKHLGKWWHLYIN